MTLAHASGLRFVARRTSSPGRVRQRASRALFPPAVRHPRDANGVPTVHPRASRARARHLRDSRRPPSAPPSPPHRQRVRHRLSRVRSDRPEARVLPRRFQRGLRPAAHRGPTGVSARPRQRRDVHGGQSVRPSDGDRPERRQRRRLRVGSPHGRAPSPSLGARRRRRNARFSPDERLLVSRGVAADKKIFLWDTETGCIVAKGVCAPEDCRAVAFSLVVQGGRHYTFATAGTDVAGDATRFAASWADRSAASGTRNARTAPRYSPRTARWCTAGARPETSRRSPRGLRPSDRWRSAAKAPRKSSSPSGRISRRRRRRHRQRVQPCEAPDRFGLARSRVAARGRGDKRVARPRFGFARRVHRRRS